MEKPSVQLPHIGALCAALRAANEAMEAQLAACNLSGADLTPALLGEVRKFSSLADRLGADAATEEEPNAKVMVSRGKRRETRM